MRERPLQAPSQAIAARHAGGVGCAGRQDARRSGASFGRKDHVSGEPKSRPYIDRGKPGTLRYQGDQLPMVREPPSVPLKSLKIIPAQAESGIGVHAALERWGRWGRGSRTGAGWPDKTLLARVIEYGALGAAQGHYGSLVLVGKYIEYDEICSWAEAAIA